TPAPALLVLTCAYSLTSPLSLAGIRALLPGLVPPETRDRANALDTAIHGLTDVVGPAAAGALVGFAGPQAALGCIGLAFIAAATPGQHPAAARRVCRRRVTAGAGLARTVAGHTAEDPAWVGDRLLALRGVVGRAGRRRAGIGRQALSGRRRRGRGRDA